MIKGYWKTQGKIPIGKEQNRKLHQEPPEGDHCIVYDDSIVSIDIDDYNHKTGEIVNPVKGKPRSEAIIEYLKEHEIIYNGIRTENGVHLDFKKPSDYPIDANKNGWICPLGVEIEVKVTKVVELITVNGVTRQCFMGSFTNQDIDELPPALYPIQKSLNKPFDMDFSAGNRNNRISEYAFHLSNIGITTDEVKRIIIGLNKYFVDDPLSDDEIDLILRPETLEKLGKVERERVERSLTHVQVGNEVIEAYSPITVDGVIYGYKNGAYSPLSDERIGAYIRKCHPSVKTTMKNEAVDFIKDITFRNFVTESDDLINVRNGLLKIGSDGSANLIQHKKEFISFRQFNATYDPEARSEILRTTLNKFFSGDNEQLELFKQMMGYILMNNTDFQKCFFFVGSPSSGKSKILNMISEFCGRKNVSNLTLKELDDRFRTANIVGKIANINADLEKATMTSSGNFKALTTGDSLTLEKKYGKPFEYVNTAKLLFASNQYPDFSRDAEGIHRRVIIFPCNHVFRKTDKDFNPRIDLDLKTDEAMSDLLNMAIEGYSSLMNNDGFIQTEATESASENFKMETDSVYRWLKESDDMPERLERDPIKNGFMGLYPDYAGFSRSLGEEPRDQKDFSKTVCQEYGLEPYQRRVNGEKLRFYRLKK